MKRLLSLFVLPLLGLSVLTACTGVQPGSGPAQTSNASAPANASVSPSKNSNEPPAAKIAQTGTGSIEVVSNPPGARVLLVSVDEGGAGEPQPRGITPTTIAGVYPGKYTVDLEKPGYRFFQRDVVVKEGITAKVKASLRKQ